VPEGFAQTPPVKAVLAGSIAEKQCPGCDEGWLECDACEGSGTQDCPEKEKCRGCDGGADACWSCGGTGKRGSRKPPAKGQRKARTDFCKLCGEDDVACPDCSGEQIKKCDRCNGTGHRPCDECKGRKRFEHDRCEGFGHVTTFTEVVINHTVKPTPKGRIPAPAHLWWQTRRAGWRQEILTSPAAELPADLPETLRPEVERRLAFAKGEVLRKATLRFLPVARVEVVGDPEWVYFAFPERPGTDGGLKVVRRPARQRVVRLAGIAATAVVIAVLVAWLGMKATG